MQNINQYAQVYKQTIDKSKTQILYSDKNMSLSQLIARWFEVKKYSYRTNTLQDMQRVFENRIYKYFDNLKITANDMESNHLEEYYYHELCDGLNPNTVIKYHGYIKSALTWAEKKYC